MKCNFSREDIINYAEGGLSQDKTAEIKRHIDNCEECRRFYGVMVLSAGYASREVQSDKLFYEKVIGKIDSNRYKERKLKYSLGKILSIVRPALKPTAAAAAICAVALLIGLNGQQIGDFMSSNFEKKIVAGNNQEEDGDNIQALNPTPAADSVMPVTKDRPETKSDNLSIEGMNEVRRFNLVKSDSLGFSTYITDDLVAEPLSTDKGDALYIYTNYVGKLNKNVFVRFYSPGNLTETTVEEMSKSAEQDLKSEGYKVEKVLDTNMYFYADSEVELKGEMKDETGTKYCKMSIFRHEGRIYSIMVQYPMEFAEGFEPRVKKMLDEIIWYDGLKGSTDKSNFIIKIGSSGNFESTVDSGNVTSINDISQYTVGIEQSPGSHSEFTATIDQSRDSYSEYPIYIKFPGKELSDDSSAVNVSIKPESWRYIPKENYSSDTLCFCINITDPSVKGEIIIDKVLDKNGNSLILEPVRFYIQPDTKVG
jgi:hypothetical protein